MCNLKKGHLLLGDNYNNNLFPFSLGMATEKTGKHIETHENLLDSRSFWLLLSLSRAVLSLKFHD